MHPYSVYILNHKPIWPQCLQYHTSHFHLYHFCTAELADLALHCCSPHSWSAISVGMGTGMGSGRRQAHQWFCLKLSSYVNSLGVAGLWHGIFSNCEWMLLPSVSQTWHCCLGSIVRLWRTDLDVSVNALVLFQSRLVQFLIGSKVPFGYLKGADSSECNNHSCLPSCRHSPSIS